MNLTELVERGYGIKKEIEAAEKHSKDLGEKLQSVQNQIMEVMKTQNISSMKHSACTVILNTRFSVKNPATPEDKQEFYNYLKDKKIFEEMVSVNSARLNAWYKDEIEAAKIAGDFDFRIPGLSEPTAFEYVTFRKA